MNKDCQPSPTVRKRSRVKHGTKTAQLEEKLEGLVELLKSAAQTSQVGLPSSANFTGTPTLPPLNDVFGSCTSGPGAPGPLSKEHFKNGPQLPIPTPPGSYSTPRSVRTATPHVWEILPQEAEEYLNMFRSQHTRFLPLIFIPAATTAIELQQSRPYLWHSILTVCTKSTLQQRTLAEEFRVMLGEAAFVEGTRTLDLLLAVIVYASW